MRQSALFILICFCVTGVRIGYSQPQPEKTVTGIVYGDNRETISGVIVTEKGTNNSVITDNDGKYTIRPINSEPVLVFSFSGFSQQEVPPGNSSVLDVTMTEDVNYITDIVVVAYGAQKRESITGAISSLNVDKLQQSSFPNLSSALAGRLPGLTSLQTGGGQPGSDDATLYLRGIATANDATPLIILDGVPVDNMRQIDPVEIASVSTLKDASATAVFGVRGANGAILITTRRGEQGPAKIRLRAEHGFASFIYEPERIHSVEFLQLQNEAYKNGGMEEPRWSDEIIAKFQNPLAGLDPASPDYEQQAAKMLYMYPDHDYYREFISRYAPQSKINMDISGGSDKLTYYIHAGFINQGGNLNTEPKSTLGYNSASSMQRYSFRSNLDFKVSKSFKVNLNLSSHIEKINKPYSGIGILDIILNAQHIWPITPGPVTIDGYGASAGYVVDVPYLTNATFEAMNRRGYTNESRSNLATSLGAEWDLSKLITPGLRISGLASIDTRSRSLLVGNKKELTYVAVTDYETDELQFVINNDQETLLSLTKSVYSKYTANFQARINYNRSFNEKHNVGAMLLAQRDMWELEMNEIPTDAEIPFNVISLAARFTYDYDNRYFAEVNLGYNGSEQFAPANRFGFFPAVSAAWVVTNERFLAQNKVLTFLKLRASFGKVGNDKIGKSRFLYMDNMEMNTSGALPSLGSGKGVTQGLLGNTSLQWEVAEKQNYGIDFNLFKDVRVALDYFYEFRDNILITRQSIPAIQGVKLSNIPKMNMGQVVNQGFEVEVNYDKSFRNGFRLSVQANYSYNRNRYQFSDEPILGEDYVRRYRTTGYAIGQLFGYKIDWDSNGGYWTSREEIENSNLTYDFGIPRPGDFKYQDINKDGIINDKDMVPIGYSSVNPRDIYGLTLTAEFKGFDFMVFFQGVGRYSKFFNGQGIYESSKSGMYFGYHKNAWTEERFNNNEYISYPALSTGTSTSHIQNDFFIMDRSYVRLRNIEIGYSLPKKLLSHLGMDGFRIYVGAQNLYTWHRLRMDHIDPDLNNSISYPNTKMLNFGCSVNF